MKNFFFFFAHFCCLYCCHFTFYFFFLSSIEKKSTFAAFDGCCLMEFGVVHLLLPSPSPPGCCYSVFGFKLCRRRHSYVTLRPIYAARQILLNLHVSIFIGNAHSAPNLHSYLESHSSVSLIRNDCEELLISRFSIF